jgi:hypothetical protein
VPRWRKDGRELFYTRADGSLVAVAVTLGLSNRYLGLDSIIMCIIM